MMFTLSVPKGLFGLLFELCDSLRFVAHIQNKKEKKKKMWTSSPHLRYIYQMTVFWPFKE